MTTDLSKDLDDLSEDYYVRLHREVKTAMEKRAMPTHRGKRRGAPTTFSPDVAVRIVKHLANGGLMVDMAKELKTLPSCIWEWEQRYAVFAEAVARARLEGAIHWLEEARRLADEEIPMEPKIASAMVQRQRLRVDTRIRLAGIFNPALSEKHSTSVNVASNAPIRVEVASFAASELMGTSTDNFKSGGPSVDRRDQAKLIALQDQKDKR